MTRKWDDIDSAEREQENIELLKGSITYNFCFNCGASTQWFHGLFNTFVCSPACAEKLWERSFPPSKEEDQFESWIEQIDQMEREYREESENEN